MNVYCKITILIICAPNFNTYRFLPERELSSFLYTGYNSKSNPVVDIKDVPHHVLIVYGTRYCSGSLIGSKIVVTAASCFVRKKNETIVVKIGASSMIGMGQIISVVEYKVHEYYKHLSVLDNDIALLILQNHVEFGADVVKTVLVDPEVALRVGTQVVVTGWAGTDLPVKYINFIVQSEMLVIDRKRCKKRFAKLITPSNYCVRYNVERHLSDNGRGAIFDNLLVGIMSSGTDINNTNYAILTNVSYFHRWITLNTNRFLKKYCLVKDESISTDSGEYNNK